MFRRQSMVSELHNEQTFYKAFVRDLGRAKTRIIIESPFITLRRFRSLEIMLEAAICRGVRVVINTRDPDSHESMMREQAIVCVEALNKLGAEVLYTVNLHRKLAIIDDVLWEGSLNILSQNNSCEEMRRTSSATVVKQMVRFIKLGQWYN